MTPSKYQSGEINRTSAISRCGDEMMRVMLYEAALLNPNLVHFLNAHRLILDSIMMPHNHLPLSRA
jgi:transposase